MWFLACLMIIAALLMLVFFHGSILQTGGMLVFGLLFLGSSLFLKTDAQKKLRLLLSILGVAGFLACGLLAGRESRLLTGYEEQIAEVKELIRDSDTKEAKELLATLKEEYGKTEELLLLEAELTLKEEGGSKAFTYLKINLPDDQSADYYLLKASCYHAGVGSGIDQLAMERQILIEGARKYPDSFLLNFRAGCICAAKEDYPNAEYYLMQAYLLSDVEDAYVPYVLACVYSEMEEYEYAYAMMDTSVQRGAAEIKECREDEIYQWYLEVKGSLASETNPEGERKE